MRLEFVLAYCTAVVLSCSCDVPQTCCTAVVLSYLLVALFCSCPKWLEFFLAYCGVLAFEGDPVEWSKNHRWHHLHSDTQVCNGMHVCATSCTCVHHRAVCALYAVHVDAISYTHGRHRVCVCHIHVCAASFTAHITT